MDPAAFDSLILPPKSIPRTIKTTLSTEADFLCNPKNVSGSSGYKSSRFAFHSINAKRLHLWARGCNGVPAAGCSLHSQNCKSFFSLLLLNRLYFLAWGVYSLSVLKMYSFKIATARWGITAETNRLPQFSFDFWSFLSKRHVCLLVVKRLRISLSTWICSLMQQPRLSSVWQQRKTDGCTSQRKSATAAALKCDKKERQDEMSVGKALKNKKTKSQTSCFLVDHSRYY